MMDQAILIFKLSAISILAFGEFNQQRKRKRLELLQVLMQQTSKRNE